MTNTFSNSTALPVTLTQIQRLAQTLQKRMNFDTAGFPAPDERMKPEVFLTDEPKVFSDRRGAGAMLAAQLTRFTGRGDVAVVGIPQGGVVVAAEIARQLRVSLSTWVVKKLQARLLFSATLGAVGEDGELLIDEEAFQRLRVPPVLLIDEVRACRAEVKRRSTRYREVSTPAELTGRTVIVVDDGVASGHTMRAALNGLRRQRPKSIIMAVPAAPVAVVRQFQAEVDEVIALETTATHPDLAQRYVHFPKVESDEIVHLLHEVRYTPAAAVRLLGENRVGSFAARVA